MAPVAMPVMVPVARPDEERDARPVTVAIITVTAVSAVAPATAVPVAVAVAIASIVDLLQTGGLVRAYRLADRANRRRVGGSSETQRSRSQCGRKKRRFHYVHFLHSNRSCVISEVT